MSRYKHRTVYSTDPAFKKRCPRCGRYPCRCPKPKSLPPQQQTARIFRERKGRGGKTVTVIRDLQLTPQDLKALGKQLKTLCGSGGTVKDGHIEVQGDHREKIADELQRLGYKFKFVGG
jgi:translation initiation factor 1